MTIFSKLSTGLSPRSSYIIRGIYGNMTEMISVRAYCSCLEQRPECLIAAACQAPKIHYMQRPDLRAN